MGKNRNRNPQPVAPKPEPVAASPTPSTEEVKADATDPLPTKIVDIEEANEEELAHDDEKLQDETDELDAEDDERPQQQDTPRSPRVTSRILHCGMPIEVFNEHAKVFCNGCHDWVKVEKCELAPKEMP
jgi:hypothetical protein